MKQVAEPVAVSQSNPGRRAGRVEGPLRGMPGMVAGMIVIGGLLDVGLIEPAEVSFVVEGDGQEWGRLTVIMNWMSALWRSRPMRRRMLRLVRARTESLCSMMSPSATTVAIAEATDGARAA